MAATRLQAGTKPPRAHCIGEKKTQTGKVTKEQQECIVRCYLPSVFGRLTARAKNIGMKERGTFGALDPLPYAFQR